MEPKVREQLSRMHPEGHPKTLWKKACVFSSFWKAPGAPLASLWQPFRYPEAPLGTPWAKHRETKPSKTPETDPNGRKTKNSRDFTEIPPRPAANPPRSSPDSAENHPRTRRTNSRQKISFAFRLLRRDLAYDKRLEQKWGGGAPPEGDIN